MNETKLGIVGCGNISSTYLKVLGELDDVEAVACADIDLARAEARAAEFGLRACTVEALLADPEIEIVLNLTVPGVHTAVALDALQAGKSVYNEKPLAIERADGQKLLEVAAERGLRVGARPIRSWRGPTDVPPSVDDGAIGRPVAASAFMLSHGPENWHPDPEFFYQPGGGPLFDMGPYYLTALIALLGPIVRVTSSAQISFPERVIGSKRKRGQVIRVETPTHISGVLDFAGGAVATLVTSFDVWATTLPRIEIYGSEGTLSCPDPNTFDGPVRLWRAETANGRMSLVEGRSQQSRGLGVADMAQPSERPPPSRQREMAYHVLDVMHALLDASQDRTAYRACQYLR